MSGVEHLPPVSTRRVAFHDEPGHRWEQPTKRAECSAGQAAKNLSGQQSAPGERSVRPGRNVGNCRGDRQAWAFSYASRTSAETRPRLLTSWPWAWAQARMSLVLDEAGALAAVPRLRRPPVFRACPSHGEMASRRLLAFFEERSISYSVPSSAKLTVSSAVTPT